MSDRIIRAASAQGVRTWTPQPLGLPGLPSVVSLAPSSPVSGPDTGRGLLPEGGPAGQRMAAHDAAYEAGLRAGFENGLQQGLQQGLRETQQQAAAFAQQQAQHDAQSAQLDALLAGLKDALAAQEAEQNAVREALPGWVSALALAVARQVLRSPHAIDHSRVLADVQCALDGLDAALRADVQLVMHPATAEHLRALPAAASHAWLSSVREDDRLAPGGFLIRTPAGALDHTLENRWQQAVATFCADPAVTQQALS